MRDSGWQRFGLPDITGRKRLVAGVAVDSLGTGLFLPFSVLYFLSTTRLPLTSIGAAISLGTLLALPTSPILGPFVDRFGAKKIIVASNVIQATAFLSYLWIQTSWQLVAGNLMVNIGSNMFWTANGSLVTLAAERGERTRWFAMMRALRNAGYAAGGSLAALAIAIGDRTGYHALVMVNALSFAAAALLTASWSSPRPSTSPATKKAGYRAMLGNRTFLLIMLANLLFVLCALVLTVVLAVYITRVLRLPGWLSGALFTMATIFVVLAQPPVARLIEHARRTSMLRLAATAWILSFAMLWALSVLPTPLAVVGAFLAIVVYTTAELVFSPTMTDLIAAAAPAASQGRYFAVQQLSWGVARAVAPGTFLWLLARGTQWLWIALIGCCLIIVLVSARLTVLLGTADLPARQDNGHQRG